MRVALDARWMQQRPMGGVGRSLANLLPLLSAEAEMHLMTDSAQPPLETGLPEHPLPTPPPGRAFAWLQWSAPRFLVRFDGAFHCPWYGLPYRQPVPMVVTLHDLTFEHHREWFSRSQGEVFRRQARHAARTAAAILTVTEHVKADIVATYGVDPARVLVAPHGVDPAFSPERDPTEVLARLGVAPPYVVALGGAALGGAARRNLPLAIAAWRRVAGAGPLVVVGGEVPPHEPGLVAAGPLRDPEWAALLAGASAFLYPTAYEGFGMPALEAAASATPVVCARIPALVEVMDGAASWAEELTAPGLGDALEAVLSDPARAGDLAERGRERARGGWGRAAEAHLEAYRRAAAAGGGATRGRETGRHASSRSPSRSTNRSRSK